MTEPKVDLTNCDREPIHIIETVQPFGALIAIGSDWLVSRWSANASDYLGLGRELQAGFPLREALSRKAVGSIREAMSNLSLPDTVERLFGVDLVGDGTLFDLALHLSDRQIVMEFEAHDPAAQSQSIAHLRPLTRQLEAEQNADRLNRKACEILRQIVKMDRVMLYKFHRDETGEVIAEARKQETDSFLGLRYPASDIPKQARGLFVRNLVRSIADVDDELVPLLPADPPRGPLDLSLSTLRAASPIHLEYLRNMGVRSSLAISVVVRGKLWGLFACHHSEPHVLPFSVRTSAELLAQIFALTMDQRLADAAQRIADKGREVHDQIMIRIADDEKVGDNLPVIIDALEGLIEHDGASGYIDGSYYARDVAPTEEEFVALLPYLNAELAGDVLAEASLKTKIPEAAAFEDRAVGALAIPVSRSARDYLVLWRREVKHTVNWAGNPEKPVEHGPNGDRLTPRKSFESWKQDVTGTSQEWSTNEVRLAQMLRVTLLEVLLRLADRQVKERADAQQKQDLLIAELNHRVRNILTLIRGLIGQSRHEAYDVASFAEIVGGRIRALASAHDALTAENWRPASLKRLIEIEAEAYTSGKEARVEISGDDVLLDPTAYSTMALVVHEMMTNAAKYGALCDRVGTVRIILSNDGDGDLRISWRESGGPAVQAPTRRGFGSTIIERSIPFELKGSANIRYKLAGVEADFLLPAAYIEKPAQGEEASHGEKDKAAVNIDPLESVLLVEDNMIIAMDTEETLLELGVQMVMMAASVSEARRQLEERTPQLAILDYNLGDETSEPLARELVAAGVPVAMASGYGDALRELDDLELLATLTKPYDRDDISGLFNQAVAAQTA